MLHSFKSNFFILVSFIFVDDELSGDTFTGYTKKNGYYKTKMTLVPVNVSAKELNSLFKKKLKEFEYKKENRNKPEKLLEAKIKSRLIQSIEKCIQIAQKISSA